jgi:hypothetical protein
MREAGLPSLLKQVIDTAYAAHCRKAPMEPMSWQMAVCRADSAGQPWVDSGMLQARKMTSSPTSQLFPAVLHPKQLA